MDEKAVALLADRLAAPRLVKPDGGVPMLALPPGWQFHDLQDAGIVDPPKWIEQALTFSDADDFVKYMNRYGTRDSVVMANEADGRYFGVIDYHSDDGSRGRCEHIIQYTCPFSTQFETWSAGNTKAMDQIAFATFLEDNLPDIISPSAADMLQIALTFYAQKNSRYESDAVLQTGQRSLNYQEEIRGTTKNGSVTIPKSFIIAIPLFQKGLVYELECRFRYRIQEAKLALWYEFVRVQDVKDRAVADVTALMKRDLVNLIKLYCAARA